MNNSRVKRKYPSSISIDGNIRCKRIYPVADSSKFLSQGDFKTVGIKLTRDQAIHLACVLLAVREWNEIDITAWRTKRRADGTYAITVTSPVR